MLRAALRDLQWRKRRFLIAGLGTGLVFMMSLLMRGLSHAFRLEVDRVLESQDADYWTAPAGSPGPFSAGLAVGGTFLNTVEATPGVEDVAPVTFFLGTARLDERLERAVMIGVPVDRDFGVPHEAMSGSAAPAPGKVVVARRFGADVGDTIELNGKPFSVVGVLAHASLFAGGQVVYMANSDLQPLISPLNSNATMALVRGDVPAWPESVVAFDRAAAEDDLMRPVEHAVDSIDLIMVLLWIVAALIVASVVYITALERSRDIAVFKATGVETMAIAAGICLQAIVTALAAAAFGAAIALVAQSRFPMDVEIPASSLWTLPILAVLVGIVAGLFGVRRSVKVDPAAAFAGP
jgi:putative ABC transport system permease protein